MHAAAKSARFIKYLSQYRAPRSRWRYYQNKLKNIIILPSSINNSFIKLYSTESMDLSKDQEWKKISSEVLEVGYYLECRKNHAASIGKYAVDGCCEFMPAGDEGSVASLLCAACSCHRSFHKKVVQWLEIVGDYGSDFKPSTPN